MTIDIYRGSTGTGSATSRKSDYYTPAELNQILGRIKKEMSAASAAPVAASPAVSAPSVATSVSPVSSAAASPALSFTTGEQIGFASQAIGSVLGNILSNKQNRAQASALRQQAGLYDSSAAISLQGAAMYGEQAKAAAGIGKMNAKNLRLAAAQLDVYEQYRLRESILQAKQRIGQGRVSFAGNGVLVDSGSAALWEQDEAADAALERLDIMQQFEDQGWQYRTQANKAEAEGYAAAAQQAGAAAQAAGQAYAAALQAESARSAAARLRKKKSWGATIGVALGAGIGSILPGIGTVAGATAGAALGGAVGGVYDASRS